MFEEKRKFYRNTVILDVFLRTSSPEEAKEMMKEITRKNKDDPEGWYDDNEFYISQATEDWVFQKKALLGSFSPAVRNLIQSA